ncbi:DUF6059 family protein [Streptomyces katsurahamanus]|uniref:DUF6059 family protein n=1 Tax=Streptomyces katsurahamanus TaxID=2577098 RepID=UPI001E42B655|nr:DUF6059 family protein [Streptomyces katsurahamanus]
MGQPPAHRVAQPGGRSPAHQPAHQPARPGGRSPAQRVARRCGRFLIRGFTSLAAGYGVLPARSFAEVERGWPDPARPAARPGDGGPPQTFPHRLQGPPPGHPERLAPEVPPSPGERELWARLEGPDLPG